MKSYTESLHNELLEKLEALDRNYDPQNLMDRRLGIIQEGMDQIKEKLKMYRFAGTEDEVHYFKFVLPPTLALYYYYADKMEWDRIIRQGSPECRYKFNDRVYAQAETLRKEYSIFFEYYRDGQTSLDNFFFLRESPVNRESKYQVCRITDPCSPPLHCDILARGIAHNQLELELKKSIVKTEGDSPAIKSGKLKLLWTGKQIDCIELGYGLKEAGVFNNGEASLKDIFDFFVEALGVDSGNFSRLFQDILGRKTGYTIFLDRMRKKLHDRIDDIENEYLN